VFSVALAAMVATAGVHPRIADREIRLNAHTLRLHFANAPPAAGGRPLIVYATGDGGWHRKDLAVYKRLVTFGFPIVGFDARDYVTHLGADVTTTPEGLAGDYARIIVEAEDALGLPHGYPVVLVGVSRGAGLAVVAATQERLRPEVAGVVAVALTREEEYVKWYRRLRRRPARAERPEMVAPYEYLPRLERIPVAVIQSTRDNYLPAAGARELFGPDTPYRWLQPIQARNHSFGGARPQLYSAIRRALDWLDGVRSASRPVAASGL
jgi:pimeloyl-ACP methyl ester carboxylesterase